MPLLSTFGAASARSFGGIGAAAGADPVDISEVFSTHVYVGDGSNGTDIVNGIDLSGEGGLVWRKKRSSGGTVDDNVFVDTERGKTKFLLANSNAGEVTSSNSITSFNNNGFTIVDNNSYGQNLYEKNYVSWTFRKASKFFDVVTYTGDGSTTKTVSHSLGSTPAMIFFRRTDSTGNWVVYHANTPTSDGGSGNYTQPYLRLNGDFPTTSLGDYGNNLAPTSTVIRTPVHTNSGNTADSVNVNGATYVAYIFAHNNGDGTFGADGDQDVIKCGVYTGNGNSNGTEVNLGFEPQWLFMKCADSSGAWQLVDSIRGVASYGDEKILEPNATNAESTANYFRFTPTGFALESTSNTVNGNNKKYVYVAIRRGPLITPETATSLFAVLASRAAAGTPSFDAGFPVDMSIVGWRGGGISGYQQFRTRLTWDTRTATATATNDSSNYPYEVDNMSGLDAPGIASNTNSNAWMWRRAPKFMDVVTFKGSTTNPLNVTHGLGVVPEMIWLKPRTSGPYTWWVYHSGIGAGGGIKLNENEAAETGAAVGQTLWNNTAPTSTVFTLGNQSNTNNNDIPTPPVLFATLHGISKVGSYTGNGGTQTIDCGFTSSARYILIKRTDSTGNWAVFDTARGIASGDDKIMYYNKTDAEATGQYVNPNSSGFELSTSDGDVNASSATYIFYAIA